MIEYITNKLINDYAGFLRGEEKSGVTIEKYLRDLRSFRRYLGSGKLSKEATLGFKQLLIERRYAVASVNSMLSSVNGFLRYCGRQDCCVKSLRVQRRIYVPEERELTKEEYRRLLEASRGDEQMNLLLQTICATGIRISELRYFTVEAIRSEELTVCCKNKTRTIFLPPQLRRALSRYAARRNIRSGPVFVTRSGNCLDRSNVWAKMKRLCAAANVESHKVYPHNLRKLFARTFYTMEKDIALLADILGHGSIETTRIYIMSTGKEHRQKIEHLNLLM